MSVEFIIAIGVVVLALVALVIVGILIGKKVGKLMKEINSTQTTVQDHINHFTKEADAITSKIDHMTTRVDGMTKDIAVKQSYISSFTQTTSEFGESINDLKQNVTKVVSSLFSSSRRKVTVTPPRITKVGKTALKMYQTRKKRTKKRFSFN